MSTYQRLKSGLCLITGIGLSGNLLAMGEVVAPIDPTPAYIQLQGGLGILAKKSETIENVEWFADFGDGVPKSVSSKPFTLEGTRHKSLAARASVGKWLNQRLAIEIGISMYPEYKRHRNRDQCQDTKQQRQELGTRLTMSCDNKSTAKFYAMDAMLKLRALEFGNAYIYAAGGVALVHAKYSAFNLVPYGATYTRPPELGGGVIPFQIISSDPEIGWAKGTNNYVRPRVEAGIAMDFSEKFFGSVSWSRIFGNNASIFNRNYLPNLDAIMAGLGMNF